MAEEHVTGDSFGATGAGLTYRTSVAASDGISGGNTTGGKLWLPIWAGEVINAYDEYNMFESLVGSKTIASGTTMEFPITGTVTLHPSWNAGEELIGGEDSTASTFKVSLDKRPMAAHFEIDNVDLMQTQWEFRSELARQAAQTLSNARDKQLYSYICRAALTSQVSGDPRPSLDLDAALYGASANGDDDGNLKDWGTSLATADNRALGALTALSIIEKYIVYLQENNIPYGNLYMAVSPACFMDIRALGVARAVADAKDSQPMFGGVAQAGGLGAPFTQSLGAMHDALEYMGCTIIKTNHGSDQLRDTSAGTTLGEAKYNLDFSMGASGSDTTLLTHGIRAVMWTPDCVASLRLQGLKVDNVDDVRRNTSFTVASIMAGTGVLRPECAAIIHTLYGAATDTRAELRAAGYADVDADGYVQG